MKLTDATLATILCGFWLFICLNLNLINDWLIHFFSLS